MAVFSKGGGVSKYSKLSPGKTGGKLLQWSLDARRAIILYRRLKAGQIELPDMPWPFYVEPDAPVDKNIQKFRKKLKGNSAESRLESDNLMYPDSLNKDRTKIEDAIWIIDLDDNTGKNKVVKLPFIPKELEYNSESTFVAIKPMGRNTPGYHFTGAEDKLEFEIDWHSFDDNREDVINNCRLLESLSKGDGYISSPHRIMIQWGNDDKLFRDHVFIVLAAPYRMVQFNKAQMDKFGNITTTAMLPVQAYQKVSLARIASANLTYNDIRQL